MLSPSSGKLITMSIIQMVTGTFGNVQAYYYTCSMKYDFIIWVSEHILALNDWNVFVTAGKLLALNILEMF